MRCQPLSLPLNCKPLCRAQLAQPKVAAQFLSCKLVDMGQGQKLPVYRVCPSIPSRRSGVSSLVPRSEGRAAGLTCAEASVKSVRTWWI